MIGHTLQLSAVLVLSAAGAAGAGTGAAFPESRLITPAHGALLNTWANQTVDQKWELCYTSFTMDKSSPAEFHKRCDEYKPTMTVAHNSGTDKRVCEGTCYDDDDESYSISCDPIGSKCYLPMYDDYGVCGGLCPSGDTRCPEIGAPCGPSNPGNFTFGGFADDAWTGYVWQGTDACFIFGLGPGEPERFGPTGNYPNYMETNQDLWPMWGNAGDLSIGTGGPPGSDAFCRQGHTYTGSPNQICGGDYREYQPWGETELEVWRQAE